MKDMDRCYGTVVWFNNQTNYGFIEWELHGTKQKDILLHWSDINCEGFKTVKKDQKVSFTIGLNNKGLPKATDVTVMDVK